MEVTINTTRATSSISNMFITFLPFRGSNVEFETNQLFPSIRMNYTQKIQEFLSIYLIWNKGVVPFKHTCKINGDYENRDSILRINVFVIVNLSEPDCWSWRLKFSFQIIPRFNNPAYVPMEHFRHTHISMMKSKNINDQKNLIFFSGKSILNL